MTHDFRYVPASEYAPVKKKLEKMFSRANDELDEMLQFNPILTGSAKYGLVTREFNGNKGYDLDYFLCMGYSREIEKDAQGVKDVIREVFNSVSPKEYRFGEDNTSVITIKVIDEDNKKIKHSCDLAIGFMDNNRNRYVIKHNKKHTGYFYNRIENLSSMDYKYNQLKKINCGIKELRESYLRMKNNDNLYDYPSYIVLKQAINNLYHYYYPD